MLQPIFFYDDYKAYVRDAFASREQGGRGQRQKLAKFLNCQDSYVSLVLSGERDFSIEQGEGLARFLHLNEEETAVLLDLLLMARSGTEESRKYFSSRIQKARTQFLHLRDRVKIQSDLSDADKATYYSSALFAKVHMYLTIPGDHTAESLAKRFRVTVKRMDGVLRFLSARGLIQEKGGKYFGATKFLFVDRNSPFIGQHHMNWRMDASSSIQAQRDEDLHLSMTFTLSKSDAAELRLRIAQFLDSISGAIKESKEEKLMALCLDYYEG